MLREEENDRNDGEGLVGAFGGFILDPRVVCFGITFKLKFPLLTNPIRLARLID